MSADRLPSPEPQLGADPGRFGQRLAQSLFRRQGRGPDASGDAPAGSEIDLIAARCRSLVHSRALVAAGASVVPLPGLDVLADVTLLIRLLDRINTEFGLSHAQIESLQPAKKVVAFKTIGWVGNRVIGKVVTHSVVLHVLKTVGVRMTAKQATKYVPLAGQAVSAVLAFTAMRQVCMRHIDDCIRVRQVLVIESA